MIPLMLLPLLALDPPKFGPGGRFQLEESRDGFGMRSHGILEQIGPNQTKFYPLPQSTPEKYRKLRPQDARINPFTPDQYERQEVIGPYQLAGGKLWFGNSFYDSEGDRGVGAFGYFDPDNRRYQLFSPVEIARYEIGAILVEEDCVWLALDQFVEDISKVPGGVVRWDRTTHRVQKYPLEFVVDKIRIQDGSLRLETRGGYAILTNGVFRRFLDDGTPIQKFPPPPSKQ